MAESQPSSELTDLLAQRAELQAKIDALQSADAPTKQQTVNPQNVSGEIGADGVAKAINYDKLIEEFGTKKILEGDLRRFEEVTGHKPHRFMRRGIVFSHRDLNLILDRHEKGEPFFLYTGRGPSSDSMHIGHTIPFDFTQYLQDVFDVPLIIMLTDDEKYLFGPLGRMIEDVLRYTDSNVKDIISAGFDPKKTFIFSDYDYIGNGGGAFYRNVTRLAKHINFNTASAVFGFDGSSNVGKIHFGAIQGATSFASSFPHIFGYDESITNQIPSFIPCAIDQDPYFRMTRDVAARLHLPKPALIHARFLDALQGPGSKMSASIDSSAIFMRDTPNQIKNKITKYAFSGGRESIEEHREKGGNAEVDVSFQYLRYFMEDDDELARIKKEYETGKLLTGELKAICIQYLQAYVKAFQERRAEVTDEMVKDFFSKKELVYNGNRKAKEVATATANGGAEISLVVGAGDVTVGEKTKNQLKKEAKEKAIAEKKAAKDAAKARDAQ